MSLCILISLLFLFNARNKIRVLINKKIKIIFLYMLSLFVVYQLLNINYLYVGESLKVIIKNFIVIMSAFLISSYVANKKCENKSILITYIVISTFIVCTYFVNFDNFQGIKQIIAVQFKKNLKQRKFLSWFLKFLWIAFFVVFSIEFIYYFRNIDLLYIINDTNRLSNYTINIPILFMYNKQLFGIGAYWPVLYMTYGGTQFLDSWYLYMFITCGFVGLALSIIFIIILAYYIFKNSKNTLLSTFTKSLFITQLYYSIFESFFFRYDLLGSFILLIFVITTVTYNKRVIS